MQESDINSSLSKALCVHGWAYKIPDPPKIVAEWSSPRPFDIFCTNMVFTAAIETKLLKGYQAFPFSRLREHQISNLLEISKKGNIIGLVAVAFYEPRKCLDLFFIDIHAIVGMAENSKSIKAKQFRGEFGDKRIDFKKKEIDPTVIMEKIIWGKE